MSSWFLVPSLSGDDRFALDGSEGRHAATVSRVRVGETIVLCDGRGGTASAVVQAVGRGTVSGAVLSREYASSPAEPLVTVVQALAKGDRGELAVQAMTEAGVDEIVPWAARRSIARWRPGRWEATAREAAKQCHRPWLPVISPPASLAEVASRATFVLHGSASARLSTVELPASLVLVVGPEGGIDDDELAAFVAAGAVPVRLGPTVLRTSTAGVAALAVLSARLGRW